MKVLTVEQAARLLDLKPRIVAMLCERGLIRAARVGGRWLIDSDDIRLTRRRPRKRGAK